MLFHEMFHVIISIHYFLYLDPFLNTRYGFEVMHIMKDYNYFDITTCSQLLRLNLVHNVISGNAPCHNFNFITSYTWIHNELTLLFMNSELTVIQASRLVMGLKLYL